MAEVKAVVVLKIMKYSSEQNTEVVPFDLFHAVEHGDGSNLAGSLSFPYSGLTSKSV